MEFESMDNFNLLVGNEKIDSFLDHYYGMRKYFDNFIFDNLPLTSIPNNCKIILDSWDETFIRKTPGEIREEFNVLVEKYQPLLEESNSEIWIVSFHPVMLDIFNRYRHNVYVYKERSGIIPLFEVENPHYMAQFALEDLYLRDNRNIFSSVEIDAADIIRDVYENGYTKVISRREASQNRNLLKELGIEPLEFDDVIYLKRKADPWLEKDLGKQEWYKNILDDL
jgi:hypothetical protein